jgi:hypothetical protein
MPIWAVGCALVLLAAILVAHPYAEVGISDDFSYIRIAQVLAETGHIVYTGWVTPILGWQLYLAAIFIKLFGFSFTSTRASIMSVSVITAFLCQRTFVRAGANEWNAGIGTLTLMLSPLLMPLEVTYMTDIPGLFATVLCLYACLRAIQSGTSRGEIAWISFAALSNVALGSSRQIAWLGVLVMVPSALWILRKSRRVLMVGAGFWILSGALIFGINYWFEQQPYTQVEPLIPGRISLHVLNHLSGEMVRACFEVVLLLLPVLLMFLPALWRKTHPWQVRIAGVLFLLGGLHLWHTDNPKAWFAPYLSGVSPFASLADLRPVLTIAVVLCMLALLTAVLTQREGSPSSHEDRPTLSNRTIGILILPFVLAYIGLISPRLDLRASGIAMWFPCFSSPSSLLFGFISSGFSSVCLSLRWYWQSALERMPRHPCTIGLPCTELAWLPSMKCSPRGYRQRRSAAVGIMTDGRNYNAAVTSLTPGCVCRRELRCRSQRIMA